MLLSLLSLGIYQSVAFAVPPVVIGSVMTIFAFDSPKGFVGASVMAESLKQGGGGVIMCVFIRAHYCDTMWMVMSEHTTIGVALYRYARS